MSPGRRSRLILAGLLACACADSGREPPAFDTSGAEGAVAARLDSLRAAAAARPGDARTWGRLALSLHAHGYPDAALEAYDVARDLEPGEFAYHYLPAGLLAARGNPRAEDLFESALVVRPDFAPLLVKLAEWRLDHGEASQVEALLDTTAAMREAPAHANLLLARADLAAGDTAGAVDHLGQAASVAPRFGAVHSLLAALARQAGDVGAAELAERRARLFSDPAIDDEYQGRLAAEGVSSRWHILRGQAMLRAGASAAAVAEFQRAGDLLPDDPFVAHQLGLALQGSGRFEEAAESFGRALALNPSFADAWVGIARARVRLGDVEAAIEAARHAVEVEPAAPETWLTHATLEQARGRHREAARLLADGLQATDFEPRIALRLAWLLATSRDAELRDGDQAVALAEAANQIEGFDRPESVDVLAAAYAEYGDFERAVAAAERAAALAAESDRGELAALLEDHLGRLRARQPIRE